MGGRSEVSVLLCSGGVDGGDGELFTKMQCKFRMYSKEARTYILYVTHRAAFNIVVHVIYSQHF